MDFKKFIDPSNATHVFFMKTFGGYHTKSAKEAFHMTFPDLDMYQLIMTNPGSRAIEDMDCVWFTYGSTGIQYSLSYKWRDDGTPFFMWRIESELNAKMYFERSKDPNIDARVFFMRTFGSTGTEVVETMFSKTFPDLDVHQLIMIGLGPEAIKGINCMWFAYGFTGVTYSLSYQVNGEDDKDPLCVWRKEKHSI